MPRVEDQLREYFDAGVERVTAEDVIVRAAVAEDRYVERRRRLSPAWAAVGAFVITLVVFGGSFFAVSLIPAARDVAGFRIDPLPGSAGSIPLWPIGAVSAAGVAGITAWLVRRTRGFGEGRRQGKVRAMETIERQAVAEPRVEKLATRNRWLTVAVIVLIVALLALGAWMLLGMRANSPTAAPADVAQLMDDYVAAWNAYDADALEGLVTADYRIWSSQGSFDHDMTSVREYLLPYVAERDWVNTYEGPWYAVGGDDGRWAVAGEGTVITGSMYADGEGMQEGVFRIVEESDGTLRVAEHFLFAANE